jgi:hypothetical protein
LLYGANVVQAYEFANWALLIGIFPIKGRNSPVEVILLHIKKIKKIKKNIC